MDSIQKVSIHSRTHDKWKKILLKVLLTLISTPTWSEECELPDASYSVSDIQDLSGYIL